MTAEEENLLVHIIVQCVKRVLEMQGSIVTAVPGNAAALPGEQVTNPAAFAHGARFIDVAPQPQSATHNGSAGRSTNGNREEVRASLRRFMRQSEQITASKAVPQPAAQNGARAASAPSVTQVDEQKRQVITQTDILDALKQGQRLIVLRPDAIVTPLARQVAKEKGIELQ